MKQVYITLQQIKALHPCADQMRAVYNLFGKKRRMLVTEQRAVALASRFKFHWLAAQTLFGSARRAYDAALTPARLAYDATTASAQQAFDAATASARQAYYVATASAQQAYYVATAPARQARDAATARAQLAYDVAIAHAWARSYIKQQQD